MIGLRFCRVSPRAIGSLVALLALVASGLWLLAGAGTDVPFWDQWDAEGKVLYPLFCDGSLTAVDLFRAHNEHRIVWTKLLDLLLFWANGAWDPLLQQIAGVCLRALAGALFVWGCTPKQRGLWAAAVSIAGCLGFWPVIPWHNVLWGFQTQVVFSIVFGLLALAVSSRAPSLRTATGVFAFGVGAELAMGSGLLVGPAIAAASAWRAAVRRQIVRADCLLLGVSVALCAVALALRVAVPAHATESVHSVSDWLVTFVQLAGWPHTDSAWAWLAVMSPVVLLAVLRLRRPAVVREWEVFALGVAFWAILLMASIAWQRGGSDEMKANVPSRYSDFLMLLPMASAACACALVSEATGAWRARAKPAVFCWAVFLLMGYAGDVSFAWRAIVRPRLRDKEAPVRIAREFLRNRNGDFLRAQPRLYSLHPDPSLVLSVIDDPRLQGRFPPSLAPDRPLGPLSRAARTLFAYWPVFSAGLALLFSGFLLVCARHRSSRGLMASQGSST